MRIVVQVRCAGCGNLTAGHMSFEGRSWVERAEPEVVDATLLVRRAGGVMQVSGHVRLPPAMRFSDHCNSPESLLDLYDVHLRPFTDVADSTHEMPYARFNREQALASWTSERRRGGDPHQRTELNEARVRLMCRDFDVTGHVKVAEGAQASRMVLEGRNRFVTLVGVTLIDHHQPDRAVELPLCLCRRDEVLMAVDEPMPAGAP